MKTTVKHVHEFAQFLHNKSSAEGFIVFGTPLSEIFTYYGRNTILYFMKNEFSLLKRRRILKLFPRTRYIQEKDISEEFVADKIYISLGSNRSSLPAPTLRLLHDKCLFSIDCTVRKDDKNTKGTQGTFTLKTGASREFRLSGSLGSYSTSKTLTALAIIPVYNEVDIVGHTARHLLQQGLDVHLIDDWSNDGSYDLLKDLKKKYPKRVFISRSPKETRGKHNWDKMLQRISDIANSSKYDWVMFNDADELRVSPWEGVSLQDAFSFVDAHGFNAIDFTVFDYRPTQDGFGKDQTPQKFFTHGEFGSRPAHFVQIKAWQNKGLVDLSKSGGHNVTFEGRNVFPLKFLLQHYSLRSTAHAKKKLLKDRLPRLKKELVGKGWHGHYATQAQQKTYIYSPAELINTTLRTQFLETYMIERLSGIGIRDEES
jgi:hypothetical protein